MTSASTRQRFQCGIVQVFEFGENESIVNKVVLLNNIVKNIWQ